jgi:hypothetical protein
VHGRAYPCSSSEPGVGSSGSTRIEVMMRRSPRRDVHLCCDISGADRAADRRHLETESRQDTDAGSSGRLVRYPAVRPAAVATLSDYF